MSNFNYFPPEEHWDEYSGSSPLEDYNPLPQQQHFIFSHYMTDPDEVSLCNPGGDFSAPFEASSMAPSSHYGSSQEQSIPVYEYSNIERQVKCYPNRRNPPSSDNPVPPTSYFLGQMKGHTKASVLEETPLSGLSLNDCQRKNPSRVSARREGSLHTGVVPTLTAHTLMEGTPSDEPGNSKTLQLDDNEVQRGDRRQNTRAHSSSTHRRSRRTYEVDYSDKDPCFQGETWKRGKGMNEHRYKKLSSAHKDYPQSLPVQERKYIEPLMALSLKDYPKKNPSMALTRREGSLHTGAVHTIKAPVLMEGTPSDEPGNAKTIQLDNKEIQHEGRRRNTRVRSSSTHRHSRKTQRDNYSESFAHKDYPQSLHIQDKGLDHKTLDSVKSHESVKICVNKHFDSPLCFKHFIINALEDVGFKFEFVDKSILLSHCSSTCHLKTETKAHALRVKKICHNLNLEGGTKIKCILFDTENFKENIQKSLSDAHKKIEEVLHAHQDKIDNIKHEIEVLTSNFNKGKGKCMTEHDLDRERALSDKLTELQRQQSEFSYHCKTLLTDLQEMNPSVTHGKEMNCILKKIGIECNRLRIALPIYARKSEIIQQVNANQVSIILGETGSGKSTQMAQYFYDAGLYGNASIVCTQPRRVAASTLAERVAIEMAERIGGLVGYKSGSVRKVDADTKIIFTTDHSLLSECLEDPEFRKYSCIIVDEAHERSIYTDILLSMIKACLHRRPDLKLVITSATIDPEVFIRYFGTGPELRVSGRVFPVDVLYSDNPSEDFENYEKRAVSKALDIHCNEGPGDILVFLCSPVEIMRCCDEFQKKMSGKEDFKCLPLHGQLPANEQKKVFEKLPCHQRKVIFTTNCAETSVTIDGIKYVVDTGVAKEMKYDPKRNISQLGIFVISKSSANQRKGRAGRTASGKCYRLYSQEGFEMMDCINEPEILKVHLGQAVLKLAELEVNITSYDFVQAPNEVALKSAVNTLRYLGAIVDYEITDAGRWIAKLPFDPKLGFVIYEANKSSLLYDAVVLAAVMSTGSDLFYREFSETGAQVVSNSKSQFGSEYGDSFTWFNIFKAWTEVETKSRSTWCHSHGINYKSINYANQSIREVKNTLLKDLKIDLTEKFSSDPKAIEKLRFLIFNANAFSLCNFSSNVKAGYFCLVPEKQVFVHPSSILNAMNLRPEWIVYNELIKTSKDFVKGVTTIEENWVHELVTSRKLCFDLSKAKKQKFVLVHREEVGPSIFRALVGPRFSNLQKLEEFLSNSGMSGSVLTVSKDLNALEIHSSHTMNTKFLAKLEEIKSPVTSKLISEESEIKLKKNGDFGTSAVRVAIGCGGCVKNILKPDQSSRVLVKKRNTLSSKEEIVKKFEAFGEIKDIVQFKNSNSWGFIHYVSVADALAAVEGTANDEFNVGELMLDKNAKNETNSFVAKVTWVRRPVKGRGTAFITCSPLDMPLLVNQTVFISCVKSTLQVSKNNTNQLIAHNIGSCTEEEIKKKLIEFLNAKGIMNVNNINVNILRERVPLDSGQVQKKAGEITSFIRQYIQEDNFNVHIQTPQEQSLYFVGYITFFNPIEGYEICDKINQNLRIDYQSVKVSPCLTTKLHVPKRIRFACQENFDRIFASMHKYPDSSLKWRNFKHDFSIEIKSPKLEFIVELRDVLIKEIEGEIIDCSGHNDSGHLLNKAGQKFLKSVESISKCHIVTDFQREKIHLYGCNSNVSKAVEDINSFVSEINGCEHGLFSMKGHGKPPGLMNLSMATFGPNLDGLLQECGLKAIKIDWKKHCVQLIGPAVAVNKANQLLTAEETKAWKSSCLSREEYLPDCSVCLCPVEKELYRMEVCGHAYCRECLHHQVSFSVKNKEFPLSCARDECSALFVWKDIKFALSRKWIDEDKLISMALTAFVQKNGDKYKFCQTPNCSMVYEITSGNSNSEFNCPLCLASICTSCHNASHHGLTCSMAKSMGKADHDFLAWMAANPNERKQCPGCQWPIQKNAGCNEMHCPTCNTYFCWVCLQISANEQDCYRHLQKVHGGFL